MGDPIQPAVIFDLDGVIADTHSIHEEVWGQLVCEEGKEIVEQQLRVIREGSKGDEILRTLFGDVSEQEAERLGARKRELFGKAISRVKPTEGLQTFLNELWAANVQMAVATSASRARALAILERLDIASKFEGLVAGEDVARGKPDPGVFFEAAKRIKAGPHQVLVIEDSRAGVMGAKSAGMKCLGIATGKDAEALYKAGADLVVTNFNEVSWRMLLNLFWVAEDEQGMELGACAE